jgi:hypothetical protein
MAPLYGTASVYLLNAALHHSGHVIDGQVSLKYIERGHIERAAEGWGVRQEKVKRVVADAIDAIVEHAADISADADIASLPELVSARARRFAAGETVPR